MNKLSNTTSKITKWVTIVAGTGVILLAAGLMLFRMGVLGLSERNVIADAKARLAQTGAEADAYGYMTSQSDSLYAVLAYGEDRTACQYYLYANHPDFSFGWFFVRSDTLGEGVTLAEVEGAGSVWLSANADGSIASVTYADGTSRSLGGYPLVDTAAELRLFDADGAELSELAQP